MKPKGNPERLAKDPWRGRPRPRLLFLPTTYDLRPTTLLLTTDDRRLTTAMSPKRLGALAELVFMSRAAALGLTILRPNCPCRYDLVLDTGSRLLRIQVKSTATLRHGRYSVSCFSCDSRRRYNRHQIDFLAAWIVPLNLWYLIPVHALRPRARVYFYPSRRTGWSARFREAWHLLFHRKSQVTNRKSVFTYTAGHWG